MASPKAPPMQIFKYDSVTAAYLKSLRALDGKTVAEQRTREKGVRAICSISKSPCRAKEFSGS